MPSARTASEESRFLTPPVVPDAGAARGLEMGRTDLWVTSHCNQRCVFCYLYTKELHDADPQYPMAEMEEVLAAGRERGYREVYISGGEPTVARRLPEIVGRARELGYDRVKIMTNGVRFADPEYARRLAAAGLTQIALSVHGSAARIYGDVHGRDDYKRCLQAVLNLRRHAPEVFVEVNTVVTRGNVDTLPELGRQVGRLGLGRLHVQLLVPNSPKSAEHFPGHARAAAALKTLISECASRIDINFSFFPPCLMPGHERFSAEFDFTSAWFTNRPDIIVSWQRSLLAAKRVVDACKGCLRWSTCRGLWNPHPDAPRDGREPQLRRPRRPARSSIAS